MFWWFFFPFLFLHPHSFLLSLILTFIGKDIFALDKIFFPINVGEAHWVLVVVYMQERRIQFYDSLGSDGMYYLKHILHYLKNEHKNKKKAPLPNMDEWELVPCDSAETPQQLNGTCKSRGDRLYTFCLSFTSMIIFYRQDAIVVSLHACLPIFSARTTPSCFPRMTFHNVASAWLLPFSRDKPLSKSSLYLHAVPRP